MNALLHCEVLAEFEGSVWRGKGGGGRVYMYLCMCLLFPDRNFKRLSNCSIDIVLILAHVHKNTLDVNCEAIL